MTTMTSMVMTMMVLLLVLLAATTSASGARTTATGFQFQLPMIHQQYSPRRRRIQIQQQKQRQHQRSQTQPQQQQQQQQFSPTRIMSATAPSATTAAATSEVPPPIATTTKVEEFDVGPNRGDANGAALLLDQVNVYRGSDRILNQINWRIEPRSKWGLVGQNGCGKSTLLKAVMNEFEAASYEGKIVVDNTQTVGYLQQTAVSGSTRTVFEEACNAMTDVKEAKMALEEAEQRVARHDSTTDDSTTDDNTTTDPSSSLEEDLIALDHAMTQYENVGGYTQQQTVNELLKGLGFSEHQLTMSCLELSGGWQMRVSFAKLLLKRPSLALLDEPSNHLDRSARQWLANYLKKYEDGAMVLVTHDSELLSACEHIAEIGPGGKLQIYKSCTYEQYLDLKKQRSANAMTEYEKNIKEAQRLQAFVDKYGASATKASAAQSRVKKIQKMKDLGLLDKPSVELLEVERFKPRLKLPQPPPVHRGSDGVPLLALQNDASIGYIDDDETTMTHKLATNIHVEIHPGMKILIRGPNGAGKTTLLDTLRGTIPLLGGDRIENPSLKLGVFTQDLAQELDVTSRAVDLVTAYARSGDDGDINISDQDARTVMGGLGLTGDKSLRLVGELSGGEKARVALAMFALKPSNLYLLDEVSNHLDVECVEALSEALSTWGEDTGSIIVISHDKAFCEQVGFTHVLTLDGKGGMKLEQREVRESDWDSSGGLSTTQSPPSQPTTEAKEPAEETIVLDDKQRKQAFNAPKRIGKIEVLVEELEEKIAEIDQKMIEIGNDVGELVDLNKEKEELQEKVTTLMSEWEELEGLLALAAKAG